MSNSALSYQWSYDTAYTHGVEELISVSLTGSGRGVGPDGIFNGTVTDFIEFVKEEFPKVTDIEISEAPKSVVEELSKEFNVCDNDTVEDEEEEEDD